MISGASLNPYKPYNKNSAELHETDGFCVSLEGRSSCSLDLSNRSLDP